MSFYIVMRTLSNIDLTTWNFRDHRAYCISFLDLVPTAVNDNRYLCKCFILFQRLYLIDLSLGEPRNCGFSLGLTLYFE